MRELLAYVADAGYVVEIHIIVFRKADQCLERNTGGTGFVIGVCPGRDVDGIGEPPLGESVLFTQFLQSGFASRAHRKDPFDMIIM